MSVTDTTWTCPSCSRTVVVYASDADTACAIEACQRRHAHGHAAAEAVLAHVGLADTIDPPRRRGKTPARRPQP